MLICMRTTLNLDDELMRRVRRRAAESGRTITEIMDAAVRELLEREAKPPASHRLRWVTVRGKTQPAVDLTDRDALFRRMEEEK